MPTYARLDRQASRPKTLGAFENFDEAKKPENREPASQSERAAFRSWSLTGGTREASFKKRAGDEGDFGSVKKKPRAVGFATVLSMSGWSEVDAEEVEIDLRVPAAAEGGDADEEAIEVAESLEIAEVFDVSGGDDNGSFKRVAPPPPDSSDAPPASVFALGS